MKSKNSESVREGMLRFSYYLVATVFWAVCIFFGFMKTSSVEVFNILQKTREYDKIQMQQVRLTESVDSILYYARLLNVDPSINHLLMYNYLSDRKMRIANETRTMGAKDALFYKKLSSQMNTFLKTKDSIRLAKRDEEMVRMDLARCISDNKQITRKMSIGGLTYNQN
ncbi:MAG: hypothetical protein RL662_14 [Bacteroidota bacterium]|jgi:hypothetical protein